MQTIFDWVSILIFAGIATLFLQRSIAPVKVDHVWQYAPPALMCAVANQLGNHDHPIIAVLLLVSTVVYVFVVLKPKLPTR